MNFKCFFIGHKYNFETIKILDESKGVIEVDCSQCHKKVPIEDAWNTISLINSAKSNLPRWAWFMINAKFPVSLSGKNKHSITYYPDGKTVLTADLAAEQISELRQDLIKMDKQFNQWEVRPVLNIIYGETIAE